jgi:pyridoxamine 5'-phosphate oxidase
VPSVSIGVRICRRPTRSTSFSIAYPFSTYSTADQAPKVRYVVHRSLSATSNLLLTSTDHRMKKYDELKANPKVEVAFWMEKTGVQFRISGKAAVLPNKEENKEDLEAILKDTLEAEGEEKEAGWWMKKRDEEFEKMSGHLRATFARPTPGTPLSEVEKKPEDWPETIKPPGKDVSRSGGRHYLVYCTYVLPSLFHDRTRPRNSSR